MNLNGGLYYDGKMIVDAALAMSNVLVICKH